MAELWKGKIPIIRRSLDEGFLGNRQAVSFGAVPRDYDEDPVAMGDSPAGLKILTESELKEAFDEQENAQSSLEHMYMRMGIPAFDLLDQNGHGYCWAYSTGHCIMLDRLKQNLPLVRINPHATAAIIKKGRDEGGWSGLSMKFGREHGYAVEGNGPGQWPLHSRNLKYDTPELRASMALHKAEEDWYDLGQREYDQELSRSQLLTLGVQNVPCGVDYNRFGHAMCQIRAVLINGTWSPMVLNSWKSWGYYGLGILWNMWPDNAVALRASTPSDR